jgi:putative transposase
MAEKKRHSSLEIATKLAQANDLAKQGKLQSEIARTLGVSVMTLYRWRKTLPGPQPALVATLDASEPDRPRGRRDRIAELQLENSRLRRLVTDLLLEKIKVEEVQRISRPFAAESVVVGEPLGARNEALAVGIRGRESLARLTPPNYQSVGTVMRLGI